MRPIGSSHLDQKPYIRVTGTKKANRYRKSLVSTRIGVSPHASRCWRWPSRVRPTSAEPMTWTRVPRSATGATPDGRLGVVQVEGGALGADPRQRGEVVPRRRARGGPLQRGAVAPRVVGLHQRSRAPGLPHVPDERDHRGAEQERTEARDDVRRLEALLGQVVGVAAGHALDAEPVLDQEGGVEADEEHPEVDLAELLVEHPTGQLGPPEVVARRTSRRPRCRRRCSGSARRRSSCRTGGSRAPGWTG